jgi:hypothetical protein
VTDDLELFDVVRLTVDLPEHGLVRGQRGVVVESFDDGSTFEVEFADEAGRTLAEVALPRDRLEREPASGPASGS